VRRDGSGSGARVVRCGGSTGPGLQPDWAAPAAAMDLPAGSGLVSLSPSLAKEKPKKEVST